VGAKIALRAPTTTPTRPRAISRHRHGPKPGPETVARLRREADLRHEHDRLLACRDGFLDGLQVDLRLAAAGHSEEHDCLVPPGPHRREDRVERGRLCRRQFRRPLVADPRPRLLGCGLLRIARDREQAGLHEAGDHRAAGAGAPGEILGRSRRGCRGEHLRLGGRGLSGRLRARRHEERHGATAACGPYARGEHGLEHLTAPREPLLAHPLCELEHPRREQRGIVLDAGHMLERLLRQVARPHGHAIGEPLAVAAAERHPHPLPRLHGGRERLGHEVVERLVDAIREHDRGHDPVARVVFLPGRAGFEKLALARRLTHCDD
jgi:hypothetical protein